MFIIVGYNYKYKNNMILLLSHIPRTSKILQCIQSWNGIGIMLGKTVIHLVTNYSIMKTICIESCFMRASYDHAECDICCEQYDDGPYATVMWDGPYAIVMWIYLWLICNHFLKCISLWWLCIFVYEFMMSVCILVMLNYLYLDKLYMILKVY
jgi:hypothetical protein